MARKPIPVSVDFFIHYRDSGDEVRVWRTGWHGDTFEVMSAEDWKVFLKYLKRMSIPVIQHSGD